MKKVAWVTDSTSSLPKEFVDNNDVYVIPLNLIVDDESYRENIDITKEEFYKKMRESKSVPKSSQPALGEFVELYEKLKQEYEEAIAIHASSKLTGTYQSSITAANMAEFKVTTIDSKIGSFPIRKMVETGVSLLKEGQSVEYIVKHIEGMVENTALYFTPANLEQLHRSGRVSGTQMFLGNLLKLNIILGFNDGEVQILDKVRTSKKVKAKIFDLLSEELTSKHIKEICVLHTNNEEQAKEWKEELERLYPQINFFIDDFIPVVAIHTGEGTVGISWVTE